jgi:hypothetical protein
MAAVRLLRNAAVSELQPRPRFRSSRQRFQHVHGVDWSANYDQRARKKAGTKVTGLCSSGIIRRSYYPPQHGAGAGAQQLGAAGAQQVGSGAQQFVGLQRLRSFCNSRPENNLHLGWQHGSGSQQTGSGAQQVGAGAQQTGSGAQQVGAGAQHDGSGAQHDDCFLKQSNRPASAD